MRKTMYIAINQDLNMSIGKVSAQVAHATKEFLYECKGYSYIECLIEDFKKCGDTIIVVKATDNQMKKWKEEGYKVVEDYGYSEVPKGSLTACCLGIYDKDNQEVPKWIQRLRLL